MTPQLLVLVRIYLLVGMHDTDGMGDVGRNPAYVLAMSPLSWFVVLGEMGVELLL